MQITHGLFLIFVRNVLVIDVNKQENVLGKFKEVKGFTAQKSAIMRNTIKMHSKMSNILKKGLKLVKRIPQLDYNLLIIHKQNFLKR